MSGFLINSYFFETVIAAPGGTMGPPDFISDPVDPGGSTRYISAAHGLGTKPEFVVAQWEKLVTSADGYVAREKFYWVGASLDAGAAIAENGNQIGYNSTDIWTTIGANGSTVPDGAGNPGLFGNLNSNWQVRFLAWTIAPDFTSSDFGTPAGNTKYSAAHGLGSTPKFVVAEQECLIAEDGFSVGDVIQHNFIGIYNNNGTIFPRGNNLGYNGSDIFSLLVSSNNFTKTTGQNAGIPTSPNWSYKLKAWDFIAPVSKHTATPYVPLTRVQSAHGLDNVDFMMGELVCVTPEQNWVAGDRMAFIGAMEDPLSTNAQELHGAVVGDDGLNAYVMVGDDGAVVHDKNSPGTSHAVITPSNWNVEVSTWGNTTTLGNFFLTGTTLDINAQTGANIDGIVWGDSGNKIFVVDGGVDLIFEYTVGTPYDLSTASYSGNSFSVLANESGVKGMDWKPDGTRFFISGIGNNRIVEYTCSTPWDITTASFSAQFSIGAEIPNGDGRDIRFNDDGLKVFVSGGDNVTGKVAEYTLSSAYTLTGIVYSGNSFDCTADEASPRLLEFSDDGLKMFIGGLSLVSSILEYDLDTAFDITTATRSGIKDYASETAALTGMSFSADENTFIYVGNDGYIYEGKNDLKYAVKKSEYNGVNFSVAAQETGPRAIRFKTDGTKMYCMGSTTDFIFQYSLSTPWNVGTASYDGVSFDTVNDGVPTGLCFTADGLRLWVVGSGTDDIYQYTLASAWDLSTASYDGVSFAVTTNPQEVYCDPTGDNVFTIDSGTDRVYHYSLGTTKDITTASLTSSKFIGATIFSPLGLYFNPDGTKYFITDGNFGLVHEFVCKDPWTIAGSFDTGIFYNLSPVAINAHGIHFDETNGNRYYIVTLSGDIVYQLDTGG